MIGILLLIILACLFVLLFWDEPLVDDDEPLKNIEDEHLSFKEKQFYKQVIKKQEHENNRSASKNERKNRRS